MSGYFDTSYNKIHHNPIIFQPTQKHAEQLTTVLKSAAQKVLNETLTPIRKTNSGDSTAFHLFILFRKEKFFVYNELSDDEKKKMYFKKMSTACVQLTVSSGSITEIQPDPISLWEKCIEQVQSQLPVKF